MVVEYVNQLAVRLSAASLVPRDSIEIPKTDVGPDKISTVLSVVFGLFGGIALIIIILAGIQFITSQGDPQGTAKARNTIIYAAVGLAISIAAFSIITFVMGKL